MSSKDTAKGPSSTQSSPKSSGSGVKVRRGDPAAKQAARVKSGSKGASRPMPRSGGDGAMARTPQARQAGRPVPGAPSKGRKPRRRGPRRVRLTLQKLDPWSVMKISFLVSVALGIAGVVATAVMWSVLDTMGVFETVNSLVQDVTTGDDGGGGGPDLMGYVGFGRVLSLSVVVGVVDVILLTALATLVAVLYNICASLVGGLQVTLSDE